MKFTRCLAAALLLALSIGASAQNNDPKSARTKTNPSKEVANAEAEQQRIQRGQARSLLISLASDARTFGDPTLRARSLARIADALWQVDAEQGRTLFLKAWEAAEVADQESDAKLQEEIRQQQARTGGGYALSLPPQVRREVLRLVARHDRALGEDLLEKLRAQKLEAANTAVQTPGRLSEALSQRLSVARELLVAGDIDRALQFGDAALNVVSIESINFLTDARERTPALADARYARLLSIAGSNPQSDGNTVSLLSSYIFTPHLFVIFSEGGSSTSQRSSPVTPPNVSPELRMAFFQTASSILMRPVQPPGSDQSAASASAIEAKYLIIRRLLPFFEQSAPKDMVEALRGQLNALNAVVSENARRRDDEWLNRGVKPEKPAAEVEQAMLDRIDRAKTSTERDSLLVQLAFLLSRRGDMRARDFVSRIDETELRKNAQAYIDASLGAYFIQKKMTDQALEIASKGDLTHLQRAWVLIECAKLLVKTDRDRALELIETAATEARRMEVSDPFLPRALMAVATAMVLIDPTRVWDATFEAVKAANSAEKFTGEDGGLILKFQSRDQSSVSTHDVPGFNVEGIFKELAVRDYDRAVELARGFQGEGPRAVATIAIARTVLEAKTLEPAAKRSTKD